jgi:hypothetical protein
MNKHETLKTFVKYDDPVNWEYPLNFNHKKEIADFKEFLSKIEVNLKEKINYETEYHIQDASFHSQIYLSGGSLRFSNFGRMVTFTIDHEVSQDITVLVKKLCSELGYLFIESELTEIRYTGNNSGVTGIDSWWIRYFDYV